MVVGTKNSDILIDVGMPVEGFPPEMLESLKNGLTGLAYQIRGIIQNPQHMIPYWHHLSEFNHKI